MWGGRLRVSRSQHGTPCVGAPRVPHHHSGPCSFPQQQAWFYWKRRLRCRCGTVPQRSVKAVQGESRAGSGGLGTQLFHRARPAPTTQSEEEAGVPGACPALGFLPLKDTPVAVMARPASLSALSSHEQSNVLFLTPGEKKKKKARKAPHAVPPAGW